MQSLVRFIIISCFFMNVDILLGLDCSNFKHYLKYAIESHYNDQKITPQYIQSGFNTLMRYIDDLELFVSPDQKKKWIDSMSSSDPDTLVDSSCQVIEELSEVILKSSEKRRSEFKKIMEQSFNSTEDLEERYQEKIKEVSSIKDSSKQWEVYFEGISLMMLDTTLKTAQKNGLDVDETKLVALEVFEDRAKHTGYVTGKYYDLFLNVLFLSLDEHTMFAISYNDKQDNNDHIDGFSDEIDARIFSDVLASSGKQYDVGVIKINNFATRENDKYSTSPRFLKALKLIDDKVDVLIIDLRDNLGGSTAEVVRSINFFLDKPTNIIAEKHRWDNEEKLINSSDYKDSFEIYNKVFTKPVVVLINDKSASASEMFTASIRDLGRAIVVGGKSYGKGVSQEVKKIDYSTLSIDKEFKSETEKEEYMKKYTLDASGAIILVTQYKTYRLTGQSIQNTGLTPDIEIPMSNYQMVRGEGFDFNKDKIDPVDISLYDHYDMVDSYIDEVKTKFNSRIKKKNVNMDFIHKHINSLGNYVFFKDEDKPKIDLAILNLATEIASEYADSINNQGKNK